MYLYVVGYFLFCTFLHFLFLVISIYYFYVRSTGLNLIGELSENKVGIKYFSRSCMKFKNVEIS